VLSPFSSGGETEQAMRADALERSRRAVVVRETELDPGRLAGAVDQAAAARHAPVRLAGAERTAAALLEALDRRKDRKMRIDPDAPMLSSPVRMRRK
jgi:predicted glycosyltransferase